MIKISQAKINQYEKRVNAGVKWLNSNCKDWLGKIKLNTLNLRDPAICVLGQLFVSFWEKVWDNGEVRDGRPLSFEESRELGFAETKGDKSNYDLLTFVWQQKIKQLRAKA